jgi:MurNAc alpha-1-phosphate uridylyltransferase
MVLAAGRGERMRPLTDRVPKPLLPAAGKPLIQYHIEKLVAAGVGDIVVNTAWLGQQIRAFLGDGSALGARIHWSEEETALETAGGIVRALPALGTDPFLVVNADVWTDYDYRELVQRGVRGGLAHLVLVPNPAHHPQGDFALDGAGRLDLTGAQRFTFAGLSLLSPQLFRGVPAGPGPLAPLLRRHAAEVTGEIYRGLWFDIGTAARLAELEAHL